MPSVWPKETTSDVNVTMDLKATDTHAEVGFPWLEQIPGTS